MTPYRTPWDRPADKVPRAPWLTWANVKIVDNLFGLFVTPSLAVWIFYDRRYAAWGVVTFQCIAYVRNVRRVITRWRRERRQVEETR